MDGCQSLRGPWEMGKKEIENGKEREVCMGGAASNAWVSCGNQLVLLLDGRRIGVPPSAALMSLKRQDF